MKTKEQILNDGILKEHNIPTYQQAELLFETGENRVGIVQATGTGKSYLILQFLYDHVANQNKRAIVLEPLYGIVKQFNDLLDKETFKKGMIFDNILVTHYDQLKTLSDEELRLLDYDYIILDEFHGLGAEGRGKVVQRLLEVNPNARVLGVTATPIRYLDKKRDMGDELFGDNIVRGMNLKEAIEEKVLPTPDYVMAVYSYADTIKTIEGKIKNVKDKEKRELLEKDLAKAKKQAENAEGLEDLFARKIKKTNGKFIAFCPNTERMESLINEIKHGLFDKVNKDVKIYKITYRDGKDNASKVIRDFESDKSDSLKIMLAIDMFNEGIHVKDVDGCFMFRPTNSPRIYLQQLGRVLSVRDEQDFKPLVFDIVNNVQCLDNIIEAFEDDEEGKGHGGGRGPGVDIEDILPFEIDGNDVDLNKFLISLDNSVSENIGNVSKWLQCAERYYEKFGNLDVNTDYIEEGTELKFGLWIRVIRDNYKENPENVDKNIVEFLLSLDENVFNYSREYSKSERDKMIIDSLLALNAKYPNEEPHMIGWNELSIIDSSFNLGSNIQNIRQAKRKNDYSSYSRELIEEIEKINPYALMTSNDARDIKIIKGLIALNNKYPNEEPHLIRKDEFSEIDSSFNLGKLLLLIRQDKQKEDYSTYSKELMDKIEEINPYVLKLPVEARDMKIIKALKDFNELNDGKNVRITRFMLAPKDSSFKIGSFLHTIRVHVKRGDYSRFSKELVEEIKKINPLALQGVEKEK